MSGTWCQAVAFGGISFFSKKVENMSKKNQYVVRNGDGWGVRGEGNSRLTGSYGTQAQAIERGREIARNQGAELRIQGKDAKFREAWSYGNDPYPPKG